MDKPPQPLRSLERTLAVLESHQSFCQLLDKVAALGKEAFESCVLGILGYILLVVINRGAILQILLKIFLSAKPHNLPRDL